MSTGNSRNILYSPIIKTIWVGYKKDIVFGKAEPIVMSL